MKMIKLESISGWWEFRKAYEKLRKIEEAVRDE